MNNAPFFLKITAVFISIILASGYVWYRGDTAAKQNRAAAAAAEEKRKAAYEPAVPQVVLRVFELGDFHEPPPALRKTFFAGTKSHAIIVIDTETGKTRECRGTGGEPRFEALQEAPNWQSIEETYQRKLEEKISGKRVEKPEPEKERTIMPSTKLGPVVIPAK